MKKELPSPEDPTARSSIGQERSFSVALEQMAQFLRTELKLKDRATKVLSQTTNPGSFNHSIAKIAKLLRTQVKASFTPKKRTWKATPSQRSAKIKKN